MKKLIITLVVAILGVVSAQKVDAQALTIDQMPLFVSAFNSQCPLKVQDGIVLTGCKLVNSNKELQFLINWDPAPQGLSEAQTIKVFDSWDNSEWRGLLGPEMADVAKMLPVPLYFKISFPSGKYYLKKY